MSIFPNIIIFSLLTCTSLISVGNDIIKKHVLAAEQQEFLRSAIISEEKEKHLCISLGFNCWPALALRVAGLHRFSFPFDWMYTSFGGMHTLIDNNFEDFLNPQFFDTRSGAAVVFNWKYAITFAHDFPVMQTEDRLVDDYKDFTEEINSKYQRRINRFYQACDLAETVYFFRLKTEAWPFDQQTQNKYDVIQLRNTLTKKFPKGNWVLVALGTTEDYKYDWNIEKIKNFYIRSYATYQDQPNPEWMHIFKTLNLL